MKIYTQIYSKTIKKLVNDFWIYEILTTNFSHRPPTQPSTKTTRSALAPVRTSLPLVVKKLKNPDHNPYLLKDLTPNPIPPGPPDISFFARKSMLGIHISVLTDYEAKHDFDQFAG